MFAIGDTVRLARIFGTEIPRDEQLIGTVQGLPGQPGPGDHPRRNLEVLVTTDGITGCDFWPPSECELTD